MHKKEEIAHPGSQISLEIDLTFIVNFEHSSQMDLSHTCPQRGLNPARQGWRQYSRFIILLFSRQRKTVRQGWFFLVFSWDLYLYFYYACICTCRRRSTRGWQRQNWCTSQTLGTTADTWLAEFFPQAKLARV